MSLPSVSKIVFIDKKLSLMEENKIKLTLQQLSTIMLMMI